MDSTKRRVCTTISVAGIFILAVELFGQSPDQRYADVNTGFAQPPNSSVDHSNPGIWKPPTRTAGASAHQPSTVTPATWSTAVSPSQPVQASSIQSVHSAGPTPNKIPFNPPTASSRPSSIKKPSSSWSSTISMIVSLLLVIVLFLGVAWFLRRVAPQPSRTLSKDVVQVLGRTPLAPRHHMILIRFGRKLVLVSQQLGQTQTLSEIDDPREVDHLLGLCEEASNTSISNSFRDVLFQLTSGKGNDRPSAPAKNLSIAREG